MTVKSNKYEYHDDWLVSAQWSCNFWVKCKTLEEAIKEMEPMREYNPHVSVHVDCEHAGVEDTLHVGLSLYEMDGKTIDEIMELFDKDADDLIASRVQKGHWSAPCSPH